MDTTRIAQPETRRSRGRECGTCSGCGTGAKALAAPRPNAGHGYTGPMFCMGCNPRFFTLDAQWSCLERMVGR